MTKIATLYVTCFVVSLAHAADTPFFLDASEYHNLAQENYVDVFFEFTAHESGKAGTFSSGKLLDVAKGFWDSTEQARRRVICQSKHYRAIANLEKPGVDAFQLGSSDFLAEAGIVIEVEDGQGTVYRSRLSPVKARQNTWHTDITITMLTFWIFSWPPKPTMSCPSRRRWFYMPIPIRFMSKHACSSKRPSTCNGPPWFVT